MEKIYSYVKARCEAMITAGIEDPSNQEGIDFCVNKCPYSLCIVAEGKVSKTLIRRERNKEIKELIKSGVPASVVAQAIGLAAGTVLRIARTK